MWYTRRRQIARAAAALGTLTLAGMVGCQDASPAVASRLALVSGNNQSVVLGAAVTSPLVVSVADQNGLAMAGVTVAWQVTQSDGTLSASSSITGSDGTASVMYTAGATSGTVDVTATVAGVPSVEFAITVTDEPATQRAPVRLPPVVIVGQVD